jgi:hypothetical protein
MFVLGFQLFTRRSEYVSETLRRKGGGRYRNSLVGARHSFLSAAGEQAKRG